MNSHLLSHHKVCKQLSGTLNEFEGLQIYKLYSAVQPQGIRCCMGLEVNALDIVSL